MSARSPITRPLLSDLPLITPTTPVRPMPVTTSSQPKALQLLGDQRAGAVRLEQDLGVLVDVPAPGGDLVLQFGEAVLDGHVGLSS